MLYLPLEYYDVTTLICEPGIGLLQSYYDYSGFGNTSDAIKRVTLKAYKSKSGDIKFGQFTGIEKPIEKPAPIFSIFPNPTTNNFNIKAMGSGHFTWQIVNLQGRELASGQSNDTNTNINLENFSPGLYILKIKSETGS